MAKEILLAGLQKIFVSCDGVSEETYKKYHVGGSFRDVMENMRLLIRTKSEKKYRSIEKKK